MAKKEKRFEIIYSQEMGTVKIYVDKATGVNYLFVQNGYAGGPTPLLNADGTVVVTPVQNDQEQ